MCGLVVYEHFFETIAHNAFVFSLSTSYSAHIMLSFIYGIARLAVPFFSTFWVFVCYIEKTKIGKMLNLF